MKNCQFTDPMALARTAGRKFVTRRLRTRLKPGDVVYHGQGLAPLVTASGRRIAIYRSDESTVVGQDGEPVEWTWQVNVLAGRYCPARCARLFSLVREVRQEALQDITDDEIEREGVVTRMHRVELIGLRPVSAFDGQVHLSLRALWASGWNMLHNRPGERWEDNPTISAIELGPKLSREHAISLLEITDIGARLAAGRARAA